MKSCDRCCRQRSTTRRSDGWHHRSPSSRFDRNCARSARIKLIGNIRVVLVEETKSADASRASKGQRQKQQNETEGHTRCQVYDQALPHRLPRDHSRPIINLILGLVFASDTRPRPLLGYPIRTFTSTSTCTRVCAYAGVRPSVWANVCGWGFHLLPSPPLQVCWFSSQS